MGWDGLSELYDLNGIGILMTASTRRVYWLYHFGLPLALLTGIGLSFFHSMLSHLFYAQRSLDPERDADGKDITSQDAVILGVDGHLLRRH